MKKISLTKMIILGLILGMIAGVAINNMAAAETAKSYAADISIFTTIFLRMVKMIIAPLVISTLVVGIAKMGDAKTLGRIFSKTFFLFICASLVSIALGLVIVNIFQPGAGINFVPHDVGAVAAVKSEPFTLKVFISHAVPTSRAYREGSGFTGTRDAEADGLRHAVCTIDRFCRYFWSDCRTWSGCNGQRRDLHG